MPRLTQVSAAGGSSSSALAFTPDLSTDAADAIGSPPDSMVWLNSGALDSAAVSSGVLNANHGATSTNIETTRNAPFGYWRVDVDPATPVVVYAKIQHTGDASAEHAGLMITKDADAYSTAYIAAGTRGGDTNFLIRHTSTYIQWGTGKTANLDTWIRMALGVNEARVACQQSTDTEPPTTGWENASLIDDVGKTTAGVLHSGILRVGMFVATGNTSDNFEANLKYLSINGVRRL